MVRALQHGAVDVGPPEPVELIDEARTDEDGAYSLVLDATNELVAKAMGNGDSLNTIVYAIHARQILPDGTHIVVVDAQGMTAKLVDDVFVWTYAEDVTDKVNGITGLDLDLHPAEALPFIPTDQVLGGSAESDCYQSNEIVRVEDPYIPVGEYHAGRDVRGSFEYGQRADSYLGIGASNDNAKWSIKGTAHMGNSHASAVKWTRGPKWAHRVRSSFRYVKEHHFQECPGYPGVHTFWIYPTRWEAGGREGKDVSAQDTEANMLVAKAKDNAKDFGKGMEFSRSTEKAYNYHGGVEVMGVELSARSGHSTWVKVHWIFGDDVNRHWLFGDGAGPNFAKKVFSW